LLKRAGNGTINDEVISDGTTLLPYGSRLVARRATVELKQYLGVLVRKWWIMVLACVVTVTSAVIFSKVRPPIYRSSAVLQVIPARYEYGLILAAEQLLRQFANQIQTTNMAQQVIDELQLDITTGQLLADVTVAPRPEDFLIQIDVDRASAEEARAVASTLARDYVAYHAAETLDIDRADRVRIRILEDARYGWVHWPKTNTLALAGGVLGLLIGLVLALGLEYLESDVLRSLEDVERHVGVPVLGSIPTTGSGDGAGRSGGRRRRSVVPWGR
jgi:capsular polysaccharide biosynthesis protein